MERREKKEETVLSSKHSLTQNSELKPTTDFHLIQIDTELIAGESERRKGENARTQRGEQVDHHDDPHVSEQWKEESRRKLRKNDEYKLICFCYLWLVKQ